MFAHITRNTVNISNRLCWGELEYPQDNIGVPSRLSIARQLVAKNICCMATVYVDKSLDVHTPYAHLMIGNQDTFSCRTEREDVVPYFRDSLAPLKLEHFSIDVNPMDINVYGEVLKVGANIFSYKDHYEACLYYNLLLMHLSPRIVSTHCHHESAKCGYEEDLMMPGLKLELDYIAKSTVDTHDDNIYLHVIHRTIKLSR